MEYVPDAEPEYSDDSVNVNCVLSWRLRRDAPGEGEMLVDFRNGWTFDSGQWTGRSGARGMVLEALLANTDGRVRHRPLSVNGPSDVNGTSQDCEFRTL